MNKISKLIIALILAVSGFSFGNIFLQKNNSYAEANLANPTSYYDVNIATWYEDADPLKSGYVSNTSAQKFKELDAFLIDEEGGVVVSLGKNTDSIKYTELILKPTYKIVLNDGVAGETFDNQPSSALSSYGIKVEEGVNDKRLQISIGPKLVSDGGTFVYGKYTIELSFYYLDENLDEKHVSFSSSIYILNKQDYTSANSYNNLIVSGDSSTTYHSNYHSSGLPYLSFNYKNFNLKVVRVYKGLSTTTNLTYKGGAHQVSSFNEFGEATSTHNTEIMYDTKTNKAFVVFKNLGAYYLTYTPINPNGNNEQINNFYSQTIVTSGVVHVFGYQAKYTSNSGLLEFKLTNDKNVLVQENTETTSIEKAPWQILGTKYSADVTSIASGDVNNLLNNIDAANIAKTNQAPIYFDTNATLNVVDGKYTSKYYYFATQDEFDKILKINESAGEYTYRGESIAETHTTSIPTSGSFYVKENYSGSPLSAAGIYLVKLNYSYEGYGDASQFFLFRLTNDAPSVEIYTGSIDEKVYINNDQYTNKDVYITKSALDVFDSSSTLTVYKDAEFNGFNDNSGTVVQENADAMVFTETARYKVELKYGNTSKKGFTTYFVIDKQEIQNIEIKNLYKTGGSDYYVGETLNGNCITNNAIAISWSEKLSGAKITCEYKFFPTAYSLSNENSLTSTELNTLYNSLQYKYSIPSTHTLSYEGGEIPVDEYYNTYGKSIILQSEALSKGGLYIFKIYDNTGADAKYLYAFIDNTPSTIISLDGDTYNLAKGSEVTTKDATVLFGKNKLIKIDASINAVLDSWFNEYLNDSNSIIYKNKRYLTIGINDKVWYSVDSNTKVQATLSDTNKYGITIYANSAEGDVNESQYIFYSTSASTKNNSVYPTGSFEYFKENYTASHTIRFSTDNSKMSIYYTTNGTKQELVQLPVVGSGASGTKSNYFQPTTNSQFNILYLDYCVKPSDTIMVASVKVNYYAFEKSGVNSTYTISSQPTSTITLYENGELKTGEEIAELLNTYTYAINLETVNDTVQRTRAGKYEIIRTYTDDSVLNENDPKERKMIFIVDRNGLISEPEIDFNGNTKYYVGSGIHLQIINHFGAGYYEESTLHYYDIYYASKLSQTSLVPVVTTNFLPVTVYIPAYKYGYVKKDGSYPKFVVEDSITKYKNDDTTKDEYNNTNYYSNYKLTAIVERYNTDSLNDVVSAEDRFVLNANLKDYNFLTTQGSNTITWFNKEGYYKVRVMSEAGDEFSFVFRIAYQAPEFDVLDTENTPILPNNNVYYTNKDTVRIAWEDSPSQYLARINQEAIQYQIGSKTYLVDKSLVKQSGDNRYYVDINLANLDGKGLNAYYHNSKINITLQFNGKREDYNNSEYFSKTVVIGVDLEAPTVNINSLIAQTGLTFYDLREYSGGYKYNTSKHDGLVRYFAFNVDISNFREFIKTPVETGNDYYKIYYTWFSKTGKNTKYIAGNTYETDITTTDLSGQTDGLVWGDSPDSFTKFINDEKYLNTYLEFIEEDSAGNRTVYTIYLTNLTDMADQNAFSYTRLNNTTATENDQTENVLIGNLNTEINLYSKRSFNLVSIDFTKNDNLKNLTWQTITIGGKVYVKSPFTNGKYKQFGALNSEIEYTLEEITKLDPNANSQEITLNMVPIYGNVKLNVYVLNKSLDVYTMAQVMSSNLYEGVLIKLPESGSVENNLLYAQSLIIEATLGGGLITSVYSIANENAKYLKEEQPNVPNLNSLEISYVTYRSARYIQVQIVGEISVNDYFVYTIVDNFGEEYRFVHIYGQTEISEPIEGDGYITQSYNEKGALVYYSSENIRYRFDTTIYNTATIAVAVGGNELAVQKYLIAKDTNNQYYVWDENKLEIIDEEIYSNFFVLTRQNNVLCVEMVQTPYDFYNGGYGGVRNFVITLTPNEAFDIEDETNSFEIFNQLPSTLNIISKNSAVDVTSILGGTTAYSGEVIINYIYTKLNHEYEILIMNPNGDISVLTDETLISEDGTYTIIINYLGYIAGCSKSFNFTIANSAKFVYSVAVKLKDGTYKNVEATGSGFTYNDDGENVTISTHYIVNSEDYQIILNSNLYLKETVQQGPIDGYTYIHKISNLEEKNNQGLITEYYSTKIAISVIKPSSDGILKTLATYNAKLKENVTEENSNSLMKLTSITPYVTDEDGYNTGVKIAWSKFNQIEENIVNVEVYYGDIDGIKYVPTIEDTNGLNSFTIKTSGTYYLKFIDLAGNTQMFGTYADNEYFTIKYLSSVIFEINEEAPINYAIYDKEVLLNIPDITINYYDEVSKPKMFVELNGKEYTEYEKLDKYSWKFTEPGLYKVWFSAKIAEQPIYEAPTVFTILSPKESRLSYSYSGYGNYYIEDILFNGKSVKAELTNVNSGEIYLVDGVEYLKNIHLHANDVKTGKGSWTFVINANNEFNQKFEFTIWINKAVVPLEISIANGGSTTNIITVSFNTQNVLTETGDCILKITGFEDLVLTQEKLDNKELDEVYNISITNSGSYYVEVTTLSGQLLYSSFVQKTEPLNTVSIIIIVVSVLVVGAGIVLFVLLRRKMKIK